VGRSRGVSSDVGLAVNVWLGGIGLFFCGISVPLWLQPAILQRHSKTREEINQAIEVL